MEIDGYEFIHNPTLTQCGGVGMYIKNGIDFSIVKNLTESHKDICESIFIEIKHPTKRNILIGTIYRHHSPVEIVIESLSEKPYNILPNLNKNAFSQVISTLISLNTEKIKLLMISTMNYLAIVSDHLYYNQHA